LTKVTFGWFLLSQGSSVFGPAVMGRMSGDVITPIPREIQEKIDGPFDRSVDV
jgi:hypothetical protein